MASRASLRRTVVAGTLLGSVFLGVAGRIAMRWYAILDYQTPYLTAGGTLNVVITAAIAGAATGVWLWLGRWLFSAAAAQQAFFWIGLILLTWRVLNPISMQSAMVFAPVATLHGLALVFSTRARLLAAADSVVS